MWGTMGFRFKGCIPFSSFLKILKNTVESKPYFGSTSYLCQRMPMGLNISPKLAIIYKCNMRLFAK